MIFPPSIMRLQIQKVNLWLPVFLLWPLFVVIGMILVPIACLVYYARDGRSWGAGLMSGPRLLAVLCHLRGLSVKVDGASERVTIAFM